GYAVDILIAERDGGRLLESVDGTEALTFLAELRPAGQVGLPGSIAGISEGTRPGLRGAATAGRRGAGVAEVTALFLAFPTWRTNAWHELGPALAGWAGSGATIAVALLVQGAVDARTAVAALLLVPVGFALSHLRRRERNTLLKVVLAGVMLLALWTFVEQVRAAPSVDDARADLASLFLWTQVIHS